MKPSQSSGTPSCQNHEWLLAFPNNAQMLLAPGKTRETSHGGSLDSGSEGQQAPRGWTQSAWANRGDQKLIPPEPSPGLALWLSG